MPPIQGLLQVLDLSLQVFHLLHPFLVLGAALVPVLLRDSVRRRKHTVHCTAPGVQLGTQLGYQLVLLFQNGSVPVDHLLVLSIPPQLRVQALHLLLVHRPLLLDQALEHIYVPLLDVHLLRAQALALEHHLLFVLPQLVDLELELNVPLLGRLELVLDTSHLLPHLLHNLLSVQGVPQGGPHLVHVLLRLADRGQGVLPLVSLDVDLLAVLQNLALLPAPLLLHLLHLVHQLFVFLLEAVYQHLLPLELLLVALQLHPRHRDLGARAGFQGALHTRQAVLILRVLGGLNLPSQVVYLGPCVI
mmetsp:Transcript_11780/g.23795  ORF Transcript_11780/g.23795 Transcript_11780/m.23795 type:complete len:303 (-) Transcript_11780:1269-2177(-)